MPLPLFPLWKKILDVLRTPELVTRSLSASSAGKAEEPKDYKEKGEDLNFVFHRQLGKLVIVIKLASEGSHKIN